MILKIGYPGYRCPLSFYLFCFTRWRSVEDDGLSILLGLVVSNKGRMMDEHAYGAV